MVAVGSEFVVAVVDKADSLDCEQPVAQFYASPPGQMVVAGPRFSQRSRGAMLAQRSHRSWWGDLSDSFEDRCDLRASEFVVAVAALGPHRHQAAVDESA
jgi:hypothetical protein